MTFRWGIMATGNVAASMAQALNAVETAEVLAVASREQQTADDFGERWGVPRRYGNYADLAADPDVDIVYVATPHAMHYQNTLLSLAGGKHVLCEKPLTLNASESADCIALARRNRLFLMEAVWMRFFPAITRLRRWINDDVIGAIQLVKADACLNLPGPAEGRLRSPRLGGGALLDLGIYPISLATMLLGFPDQVEGRALLGETGVDELDAVLLQYDGGALATLTCSTRLTRPREACIVGDRGQIKIHDPFFRPRRLTLQLGHESAKTVDVPFEGNGYTHEVEEVHACLRAGQLESATMPLADTYRTMQLMDSLRQRWGVTYPTELRRQPAPEAKGSGQQAAETGHSAGTTSGSAPRSTGLQG